MAVDMLIKKMPEELKGWIAAEARSHRRSLNQEAIALLERARAQTGGGARAGVEEVATIVARLQARPLLDQRSADEILGYDANGLPR